MSLKVTNLIGLGGEGVLAPLAIIASDNGGVIDTALSTYTFSAIIHANGLIVIGIVIDDATSAPGINTVTIGGESCQSRTDHQRPSSLDQRVAIYTFDNSGGTITTPNDIVVTLSSGAENCSCYAWTLNRPASHIGYTEGGDDNSGGTVTSTYTGEDPSGEGIFLIVGSVDRNNFSTGFGTDGVEDANNQGDAQLSDTMRHHTPNDDVNYPGTKELVTAYSDFDVIHTFMEIVP